MKKLKKIARAAGLLAGLRITRSESYFTPYDPRNYGDLKSKAEPVIFDVGANVGQSALNYLNGFPTAKIYSFEPIQVLFKTLEKNLKPYRNVACLNKAMGEKTSLIEIPKVHSDNIQTIQVLKGNQSGSKDVEQIQVITIDGFFRDSSLDEIDILKTDTEGYDLSVLKGARELLEKRKISYILSEVSIINSDTQHTNLFELRDYLKNYGYDLISMYDVFHRKDGGLNYFNALFSKV